MRAEEVHREKLKALGYKDEVIEELITKYIANCTYDFAEAYQAELLNIDSVIVPKGTLPFEFVEWYSGMNPDKIINAYNRWQKEKGNAL